MNKGNLNKLVTNYPVELTEEEIANLSGTLAPVIAACGGGGGTGGKIYTGIGFVTVNNSTNQIGLTEAANTKLNQDIPTKVSDLSDSANYQTIAGMDEYLTTGAAQNTYLSKSDAENGYAPIGTYTDVQTLKNQIQNVYTKSETSASNELSAEFDSLSAKYQEKGSYASQQSVQTLTLQVQNKQNKLTFGYDENNAISSIDGSTLAGQGGTTYTPGQYIDITNDEISVTGVLALDEYAQYEPVLMGDSNITATSSKVDNHTQWNLAINSTPVVTDTKLVGENSITAHTTNVSGEWLVGLEQTAHNAIASIDGISTDVGTLKSASAGWNAKVDQSDLNDYLTKTQYGTDSATFALKTQLDEYATKGYADNASANALSEAKTWVGLQGYLTSVPDTYALKTDIPTTVAELTDSGYYYQKTDTSSKTEITNALNTKVDKPTSLQTGKLVYDGDTSAWVSLPAGTTIIVEGQGSVTANYNSSDSTYTVSLLTSAENALLDVDKKITIPTYSNLEDTNKVWYTYSSGWKNLNEALIDENVITFDAFTDPNYPLMIPENGISGRYVSNEYGYHFGLTQTAYNAVTSVSSKLDTTAAAQTYLTNTAYALDSATFLTKSSADNDYAPISITTTVNTLTAASAGWNNKVDKPTSLNDKYLVLRTDSNGAVSGWCDFQDQSYSKSEALGTFVATANIDSTTLSGDGKSVSTKLGVKTDVIATKDYVNSSFLPLSGGTVSGDVIVSSSGTCLLTVGTEATLMGQSRVVNMGDTTARGTNWLGVSQSNQGFLKYVNGGNVGALNGTSIQINFAPDGANSYGNITVNSQDNMSKVVHVPTASYNSMSSFDDTNGPNYMLRKTASGFDIGAAVINVTALPATTEANAYYFVYDT